jgi:DHA1 family bicyclomycin/chloramphenicol resistance-like MFS transporter
MFAYIAGAPFVFMQVFGFAPQQFGVLFGLNACGLIAASQLNHALLARLPSAVLLWRALHSLALCAAALLALALWPLGGWLGVALPLFFALSSLGFSFPNATALALAHQSGRVGSAAALAGSIQFVLAAASGSLVSLSARPSAAPMAAVFCAFAALALVAQRTLTPR